VAAGLGSAHTQGIVHRDLKPENVMLVERSGDKDFVKVLDFGIAKVPIGEVSPEARKDHLITKAGMVFGTPEYMSPEQALGQKVDARSDLFSVGVVLFHLVTGKRPFEADSLLTLMNRIAKEDPTPIERLRGDVPPSLRRIIGPSSARSAPVSRRCRTSARRR